MNTEILGVILQWVALVVLCYPLGRYIAKVYRGERTWLDFMAPLERGIYKVCSIDPDEDMDWKKFLKALLMVNLFWFFWGMVLLCCQSWLPLNPDGNANQTPDLAFNTCISFMVNCNLQHYSGETGLTYFTQLFVIMLFQFITAACGMAAMAGIMKALAAKTTKAIGNFWVYLVKSTTRILMPLSLLVGILLVINGTPMSFDGKQTITTLEGQEQVISQGPTAAIVPIKQLGTNGGGYFGVNSSHPLENPNAFMNMLECWSILIIPMAMAWAFGFYVRRRKLAAWIFGVMLFAFTAGIFVSVPQEMGGNPNIDEMGIAQDLGSMEGKEIRIGSAASAMWGMVTTVTSNGSVNSMHDSQTPLSGMMQMLNMQINCWFGGVGVGWMNYFAFLIIAVFISGLMVGRTPDYLGKRIEGREITWCMVALLACATPILCFSAVAAVSSWGTGALNNAGAHGLSEILYAFTSGAQNNGSAFAGLSANVPVWNVLLALAMFIGRFGVMLSMLVVAGSLAARKKRPISDSSFPVEGPTFGLLLLGIIFIVGALTYLPALSLGPIVEQFQMMRGMMF